MTPESYKMFTVYLMVMVGRVMDGALIGESSTPRRFFPEQAWGFPLPGHEGFDPVFAPVLLTNEQLVQGLNRHFRINV
ncbi:MAG: hypothetical protein LBU18_03175 [Treponema sp.]|jgi:hypothetical protein|nr:hypothetical protein [Treponema sp.]